MITKIEGELKAKLTKYLQNNDSASRFIYAFCNLCHTIDDLIDEESSPEKILRAFAESCSVFSSSFYTQYNTQLYSLVIQIINTYADSIKWEKNEEMWKRYYSDVLRAAGNDMILAVVNIIAGYDAMRDVSLTLREYSYNQHHDKEGKVI